MSILINQNKSYLNDAALPDSLHPLLRRIYLNRGITKASQLERSLDKLIPFQHLLNIHQATTLLFQTLKNNERIIIVGDFDADGATSSAVAVLALRAMGFPHVDYIVPNRFEFGYGLTPEIVKVTLEKKPDLLITVDNGISSIEGVRYAKENNVKVLITDHHLPGASLPNADAIINPNQPNCEFPSKNLAGVGVIFYLMLALRSYLREMNWFVDQNIQEPNLGEYLDLVALGTYADVVPLDQNNRILVYQGLKRIQSSRCRPGIKALIEISGRSLQALNEHDLGFAIGPRLNAAGRLDDMSIGIECLISSSENRAKELAEILHELNHERRTIEVDMKHSAFNILNNVERQQNLPYGICLTHPDWHQGIIGILAGRIKERYHRPTIIFAHVNDNELKGSARSIEGLHIRDLLETIALKNPRLLSKFGGHAMAAGLTIEKEDFAEFAEIFDISVKEQLSPEQLNKSLLSDGELINEELTLPTAFLLREAGPFGQGFPQPLFDGKFEIIEQRLVGGRHLKLLLKTEKRSLQAIAFNVDLAIWPNNDIQHIYAAYRLDINEFRSLKSLQLIIEHLEPVLEK